MLTRQQETWQAITRNVTSPPDHFTLPKLMEFFGSTPHLFYEVAVHGLPDDVPPWAKEFAALAANLRRHVRNGYEVVPFENGGEICGSSANPIPFSGIDEYEVRLFLVVLRGVSIAGSTSSWWRPRDEVLRAVTVTKLQFESGELPPAA